MLLVDCAAHGFCSWCDGEAEPIDIPGCPEIVARCPDCGALCERGGPEPRDVSWIKPKPVEAP